ncbi:MAG: YceD family protein [Chitinophagaceae bacterium]
MNYRRTFDIAFVGLKPGIHEFEYDIADKFFLEYGDQEFKNCIAKVKLSLNRENGFMLLKFEVGGKLELNCDRCGNHLPLNLWDEFNIVVKIAEDPDAKNTEEEDPDVYYISRGESHINVSDWIYEFINLSIPMQRRCSEEEIGGTYCNKEVLEMLKNMDVKNNQHTQTLWKGLEKFKDLESE